MRGLGVGRKCLATLRSIVGQATELRFEVSDKTFNCENIAAAYCVKIGLVISPF